MFTGIIEAIGLVKEVDKKDNGNIEFSISCAFADELILGQSIAHNGVCLTVTNLDNFLYKVTAIAETLSRTNLGELKTGDEVNLERCMPANGRFDGHIVQGHVDTVGICENITEKEGSWEFTFSHPKKQEYITVEKGSICINGISLTVVASFHTSFTVAIIPFTFDNTNIKSIKRGSKVNLEFDILGKYLAKMTQNLA